MILIVEPEAGWLVEFNMDLSSEQMAELRELAGSRDVPSDVALRARIVLWSGEGRRQGDFKVRLFARLRWSAESEESQGTGERLVGH
ncbi:hypothetical protein, partial [Streptomyces mirabilis]|uniref:hypothetical protein n=1 Tax=Streptomyces mirabilis TaxID=68239 RepID=UPI0033DD01F2